MSEQVLGVIRLKNPKLGRSKFEAMFLTKDKIIVAPVCSGEGVIGGLARRYYLRLVGRKKGTTHN